MSLPLAQLAHVLKDMPAWARASALAFNAILRYELERRFSWVMSSEVRVANRGDARGGRIDFKVEYPAKLVIEVDRLTQRKKSAIKMQRFPEYMPVCILRETGEVTTE